mgnify:CR=1 FL=1
MILVQDVVWARALGKTENSCAMAADGSSNACAKSRYTKGFWKDLAIIFIKHLYFSIFFELLLYKKQKCM